MGLALSGAAGTVVPAGSAAADAEGRIWRTAEAVTLEGGAASVSAVCDLPGPVWAAPGTVTSILTAVAGWTAVTNPEGSVLGLAEETDAQARARMASALAGRGNTIADALTAAIAAIPYVRSQALHINETDTTDARGVPPHTLAAVVYLGNQEAIARAIYEKKAPGIGTWGSVTVNVEDGEGNLHPISFSRPETVLLNLTLSLARLEGFDRSAVTEALEEALRQEINGKPIGEALNVPRLIGLCYSAAGDLASTFVLTDLQASTAEATTSGLLPVAWNERLSLPSGGVTFQVT